MTASLLVAVLSFALPGPGLAVDTVPSVWIPANFEGFPVEIHLSTRADLTALLDRVPVASFNREQLSPSPDGGLVFRPRVTVAEASALELAGYRVTRLEDREQQGRRAVEAAWSKRADKAVVAPPSGPLTDYPTFPEIGAMLVSLATSYPALCDTFLWGHSVQGRELWGIRISKNIGVNEAEPEVRLSSTMHGNEVIGMIMLLNLADHLLVHYDQPGYEDVTALVDGTDIHIMPLHNPDGYVGGTRANANGDDLNRNFDEPSGIDPDMEIENVHFSNYGFAHHFVVSLNGHGGALVANYLWDYKAELTTDDAALQLLSLEYSTRNLPMYNSPSFSQGITNGFDWYFAYGTLQDWSYDQTGCIDTTMELSDVKWPAASALAGFWDDNRESLKAYTAAASYGINGVVTDASTGLPLDATVTVTGNAKSVVTDPSCGDYYKLLHSGTFELTFEAVGYTSQTIGGVATTWGTPTVLDVALQSDTSAVPTIPSLALQAVPNPFNPKTTFFMSVPEAGSVELAVFDIRGRLVVRLYSGTVPAGDTPVVWNGRNENGQAVSGGAYFGRLVSSAGTSVTKVMLVK